MLEREQQVVMTYVTWRWIWFIGLLTLACLLPGMLGAEIPMTFSLGLPCLISLTWLAGVAKWQFANPRARLMPNYAPSHLLVLGTILLLLLVLSPLLIAASQGISPWGPLAFGLLLGGCMLLGILLSRGVFSLLAMAIFFSGFPGAALEFWTSASPIHGVMALIGGGMVGYCLWFLSQLNEEMDGYQTLPLGNVQLTRLERGEQRRLIGRSIKKQKLQSWVNDYWLDHGIPTSKPTTLIQYGIARTPGYLVAFLTAIGFAAYGIFLQQIEFMRENTAQNHPREIFILCTVGMPAASIGFVLMQHLPRMSQELMFPASREQYFDRLLMTLGKRVVLLWLGMNVGLWLLGYASDTLPKEDSFTTTFLFAILSFVVQAPAIGLSLLMARWKSRIGYIFGIYGVVLFQMGFLLVWWRLRKDLGDLLIVPIIIAAALTFGFFIFREARKRWLNTELG